MLPLLISYIDGTDDTDDDAESAELRKKTPEQRRRDHASKKLYKLLVEIGCTDYHEVGVFPRSLVGVLQFGLGGMVFCRGRLVTLLVSCAQLWR
jgi:hypothetical protein